MGSQIEPNGDFVQQWLDARRTEGDLDQTILTLFDEKRDGTVLDEAGLLKSLIALAQGSEAADVRD